MSDRNVRLTEAEYERAFMHWQYTASWRLFARLFRWLEWKQWLKAMIEAVRQERDSFNKAMEDAAASNR